MSRSYRTRQLKLTVEETRSVRYFDICYNEDGNELSVNVMDCVEVEMMTKPSKRSLRSRHRHRCVTASDRMALTTIGPENGTVLEVIENKDKRGRRTVEYLIHFQGWNSSWDRCVGEDFVLKDTEENRQLQRDLAEKSQLQLGAYLYRRERKKGSASVSGSSAAKRSRHRFSDDGSSSSTQPDEPEHEETGEGEQEADADNSQGSPDEEIKEEMESDSSESSEGEPRALAGSPGDHVPAPVGRAHITLPPVLRDRLTFDYHLIVKRNRLTRLPATPCAAQILESFVKWFARAGAWSTPRGRNEPPQKPDLVDVSRRLNLVREVADGVRVYFDFIMRGNLLYKPELAQYHQVCGQFLDQQERKMKEELESDGLSQDEYEDDVASAEEDMKSPKIPEYSHLPPDPVQAPDAQENGHIMDMNHIKQEIKEEPEDMEEENEMAEEMDAELQEEMREAMRREMEERMQQGLPEDEELQHIKEEIEDQEEYQDDAQDDYQDESEDIQDDMQEAYEEIEEVQEIHIELLQVIELEIEEEIEEVIREEILEEIADEKDDQIEQKMKIVEIVEAQQDEKQVKEIKDEKNLVQEKVKIKQEKEDSNDSQKLQTAQMECKEEAPKQKQLNEDNKKQIEAKLEVTGTLPTEHNTPVEDNTQSSGSHRELRSQTSEAHSRENRNQVTESHREGLRSQSENHNKGSPRRHSEGHGREGLRSHTSESHTRELRSHTSEENQTTETPSRETRESHRESRSHASEGHGHREGLRSHDSHVREGLRSQTEGHIRESLRSHTEGHHIREGLRSQSMEGHHSPRSPAVEESFANTVRRELRPNTRSRRGNISPAVGNNSPSIERGNHSPNMHRGNHSPNIQRGNHSPCLQRGNSSPGVQRGNSSPAIEDFPDRATAAEDPHSFANTIRNQINRPATRGQRRRWTNSPAPALEEVGTEAIEIKQEPSEPRAATRTRTRSGNRKSINSLAVSAPAANTPAIDSPTVDSPAVNSPAVNSPAVNSPAVNSPAVNSPAVNSPAVNSPAVNSPAVNSPEEAASSSNTAEEHNNILPEVKQEPRDPESSRPATRSGNVARRLRSHKSAVSQSENEEPQPSTSTADPRHFEHSSSVGSGSGSSNEEWSKPPEPVPAPTTSTRTPLSLLLDKVAQYEIIPREGTEHLPCRVYGAIHLARLFVRLPDFLNATQMSDFKLKLVIKHIDMFIQYLVEHKEWFGEKYYYCDSMSRST